MIKITDSFKVTSEVYNNLYGVKELFIHRNGESGLQMYDVIRGMYGDEIEEGKGVKVTINIEIELE